MPRRTDLRCERLRSGEQVHTPGEFGVAVFTHHTSRPTAEVAAEPDRPPTPDQTVPSKGAKRRLSRSPTAWRLVPCTSGRPEALGIPNGCQAGQPQLRARRGRPHLRLRRPPGAWGCRRAAAGAAGPDHRGGRRRGVVRGAARQGVRRPRHRGGQHDPAGADPVDRCRQGRRLHPHRRHRRVAALGPRPGHRRPPFAVPAAAGPYPPGER
jgi:hypothetical protein